MQTAIFTLYWTSADKQGSYNMGDFPSRKDAEAAIPEARAELLSQCGDDEQRAGIEAGEFSIEAA